MKIKLLSFLLLTTGIMAFCQEPSNVYVSNKNGEYKFIKNGKLFNVKGAGCEFGNFELLAKCGANTVRTWRVDNGKETGEQVMEKAYKNGLMVLMGLEMGLQRHGFNYDDTILVNKQKSEILKQVQRLKDYPSLLAWGIGNELNLNSTNSKVWKAVNEIAILIHQIDPNHPVTTMLAGINKETFSLINTNCPALDFLSIQMYGDLINLQTRIKDSGFKGPYVVSEWGATGHWEVAKTEWQSPIEQTSSEKAISIRNCYEKAIKADSLNCIGNFVFVWEQKQERTPTWYGLFSENGEQTEAIDVLYQLWNNKWPSNRCPAVSAITINNKKSLDNCYFHPGEKIKAIIKASDPDNDKLIYNWEIMSESNDLATGGDRESRPRTFSKISTPVSFIAINVPKKSGAYRLFVYVLDGKNHAGTANIPFYVK